MMVSHPLFMHIFAALILEVYEGETSIVFIFMLMIKQIRLNIESNTRVDVFCIAGIKGVFL